MFPDLLSQFWYHVVGRKTDDIILLLENYFSP